MKKCHKLRKSFPDDKYEKRGPDNSDRENKTLIPKIL